MNFELKNYQNVKLKKIFKGNDFSLLFHSAKLNLNRWTQKEQKLKKLKLSYSKIRKGTTLKLFKSSIYRNLNSFVCGFILLINPNFKTTVFKLKLIKKDLRPSFELISMKFNNKIYSICQFKGLNTFSYRASLVNLYKSLGRQLKVSYLLTKQ